MVQIMLVETILHALNFNSTFTCNKILLNIDFKYFLDIANLWGVDYSDAVKEK